MLCRFAQFAALLLCGIVTSACEGGVTTPARPDPPNPPIPVTVSPLTNRWTGHYTVLSAIGSGGCGGGRTPGEQGELTWLVTYNGSEVQLDENVANYPTDDLDFRAPLIGPNRAFSATYSMGSNYAGYICQFKEATLVGTFNDELTVMEGTETLVWGLPDNETRVVRTWRLEK
jgi:hypothetical protein